MTRTILNIDKTGNVGVIDIYGEVISETWKWSDDEVSAYSFKDAIENLGDVTEIIVNINSPGGDVFEGLAIHNILKRHDAKITVNIDGLCASIASVIAMAGDTIRMPRNALMMIHNAMTSDFGNANELRETADLLDKVTSQLMTTYLDKSDSLNEATLKVLLDAETWLTADEAKHYGLVDEVIAEKKLVACADEEQLSKFMKTPKSVTMIKNTVETPKETKAVKNIYYL